MSTINQRVINRARSKYGLRIYTRSQWGSRYASVYETRRRTKPALQPADTVWQHITVTLDHGPLTGDLFADARTVERIGYERFGSGVSYNWLVDMTTGDIAEGQPLDAKGTHTVNDKDAPNFSYDQNYAGRAIAVLGMPGDKLSAKAARSIAGLQAAMMDEKAITTHYDYMPHSHVAWKDCPCDPTRNQMGAIRKKAFELRRAVMPTPTPAKARLSVMTWNVENKGDHAADRDALVRMLATEHPDVVCIQEAYKIDLQGILGYREVYHAYKGYSTTSESRAQAILVRDGVAVKIKSPIAMALSWVGPKMGVRHDPRVHRYVTVNKDRKNWRVSTWHVPFGPKPVEETRLAAIAWLKRVGAFGPAIAVGDWNALADGLTAKVAAPASARIDGGGKDRAVFRGCKKVTGKNLGDQDRSDHSAKKWEFEA